MRRFLACIMTGALFLTSGCASVGQSAAVEQPVLQDEGSQSAQDESVTRFEETARGRRPTDANMDMQIGKIVSVSADEITVELATIQRPGRSAQDGETQPRQREENQEERKRPEGSRPSEDSRAKQGDRKMPEGGFPDGGDRGFGAQMEFTYSGEQKTYALTESVKITKSMGEKSEALAIADLAKDDVVRLELDENGALVSVQLWDIPTDAGDEASDAQD